MTKWTNKRLKKAQEIVDFVCHEESGCDLFECRDLPDLLDSWREAVGLLAKLVQHTTVRTDNDEAIRVGVAACEFLADLDKE